VEAEVDDLRENRIRVGELFFSQYGHDEASLKDLALICFIKVSNTVVPAPSYFIGTTCSTVDCHLPEGR
jgi:hypothetical protein